MPRVKKLWKNKKYPGRQFEGNYIRDRKGERVFELSEGRRTITFESFQAAQEQGWRQ